MYEVLRAEMARHKVKQVDLAKLLGVTQQAIYLKISGRSNFRIEEACAIKEFIGSDIPLEDLFDRGEGT